MRDTVGHGAGRRETRWLLVAGGLVVAGLVVILLAPALSTDEFLQAGLAALHRRVLAALDERAAPGMHHELAARLDCVIALAGEHRLPAGRIGELARACRSALDDHRVSEAEAQALGELAQRLCAEGGGRVR